MIEYREHRGFTWELRESANELTFLGITIAYGLVDEPLAEHGTLRVAAEHLRREFSRPLELPGGVYVPEVTVDLQPAIIAIWVRGSRAAVAAAYRRMHQFFEQATPEPGAPMAPVRDTAYPLWATDLTVRKPGSAYPLSPLESPLPGAHDRAAALLRELSPRGRRHQVLLTTSDASLIEELDWPPGPPVVRPPATPKSWRDQPGNEFGAIHGSADTTAWSFLLPRSADGRAAHRVLETLTMQAVPSLAPGAGAAQSTGFVLAGEVYCVLRTEHPLSIAQRRRLANEILISPMPVSDPLLQSAVHEVNEHELDSWRRLDHIFGTPETAEATVEGVRAVLSAVGASVHLKLPQIEAGQGIDPGLATNDLPFLLGAPDRKPKQRFVLVQRGGHSTATVHPDFPAVLGHSGSLLFDASQDGSPAVAKKSVDLERLVLVASASPDADDVLLLVDDHLRELAIAPSLYQRDRRLRSLITQHTDGVPRVVNDRLAPLAATIAKESSRRNFARLMIGVGLAVVAVVITVFGIISPKTPKFQPTVIGLQVGETVQLHYGTRITLRSVTTEERGAHGTFDIAHLEFCAGDGSVPGSDTDIGNTERWFDPAMYWLERDGTAQPRVLLFDDTEFSSTELLPGACEEGTIAFQQTAPGTAELTYSNSRGDEVTWLIDE